jgi:hypothetical protein
VNHDVEAPSVGDDPGDSGFRGLVGGDVKLDRPEIDAVAGGIARDLRDFGALRPAVSRMLA